ncbi:MAG TPA: PTS ascorbate transporter subunit IIC [Acidimicrobiia bacterium]|nr:PTS ascorbate transporter subunit IIC [Acidimicrobiia bacterium]
MAILEFLQEILSNASILVGLLALVGLLVARASFPDVVTGTLKTIIGFLILGGGANILIGALDPLGTMISEGLGLQGVVPTNEAIVALAQEDFGAETAGIMGLAFVVNLVLARLTRLRYVFLTGHHVFFMAALTAVTIGVTGMEGWQLLITGALITGSVMVLMPAIAMPFMRRITDGEEIAMGHFGTLAYCAAGLVGSKVGNPDKSTEDFEVPRSLSFFRDSLVSTAVAMLIVYLIFAILAGPTVVTELAGGANPWVFAIIQALTFAAGVWIILVGVRMIIGEIVPAFEGISSRLIPNAVPALDVPIVFPYAPTAVIIGFATSVLGGLVSMIFLGPLGLALIIPGMVPHFFTGGGAGVFGNAMGGRWGAAAGGFVNGVLITFLPAFLLQYMGELGFANTTFGDADFAWVGIVTGFMAEAGPALVWIWAAILVAACFIFGMVFPKLRPDYLAQQGQAASEAESVAG